MSERELMRLLRLAFILEGWPMIPQTPEEVAACQLAAAGVGVKELQDLARPANVRHISPPYSSGNTTISTIPSGSV